MTTEEKQDVGVNGNTISSMLFLGNCAEALDLYKEVFGVSNRHVYKTPDERFVIHSSFMFDDKVMIMAWDDPLMIKASCTIRPAMHYRTLDDIEPTYKKALEKGFKQVSSMMCPSTNGPCDMFWGDKCVTLQDPYGHLWVLGQKHSKAMDSDEMKEAEKAWMANYDGL
eukprot:jgi/Ulvmu1/6877/UM031_0082.1